MDLSKLGKFKVNGAIQTQWETNIAVERIMIAQGKKVSGITSWLVTIEYIGLILSLIASVLIITTLTIIFTIRVLIKIVKFFYYLFYPLQPAVENAETEDVVENDVTEYYDTTEEEEEEIKNFY